MRAAVITASTPQHFEQQLNAWFEANPEVKVWQFAQTESGADSKSRTITGTILFLPAKEKETGPAGFSR